MTDKLRKYVLPNIPYVFIGWVFLKLGTAYRLAAGSDFAHKLLGLGQTIGAAFADFAPGLALFDWLVGIVGAVAFRLLIYFKSKNAKKFRRDAEYGSARWGNEKDIKPFVDPKFENNMLLTATERLTMNTRPKNPANARNLNFCGIGSSGSGKTRFWLTPQLLQAHSSYVVVDPKGGVLGQVGAFLQKRGYKIKVFNSIDFSKSMHYNPLAYIKTEADILKFVNALISNTKGEGKEGDPFWTKAETLLYCALLGYIIFEGAEEDRNMNTLVDMISGMEVKEDDEDFLNAVDYMFKGLEQRKPNCFAVKQYKKYKLKPIGFHRESTALNDTDMKYLLLYLEETYGLTNEKKIDNAIGIVANENKYHPIRDYLNTLVWDGTERIRFCLRHFLGADADDYTYEALKLFLLGAISRAFQPGCKFEIMLCLVGGQGAGKSTFFRLLAVRDEWFSDDLRKLDDDNVYRKLQGHWIIEMSEMMATANAKSIEEIKSFLSRQKEVYKIPYETHPADRPRQCVFGGTSNALDFLPLDRSGNRRFIPVMVYPEQAEVHILEDETASRAYIGQMWAEAMEIYRSGRFKLAFSPAMQRYLKEHQRDFMPEDTKAGMIQAYLDKYTGSMVCSKQLYKEALNHAFDEPKQWEIREINEIMNQCIDRWRYFPNPRMFSEYGRQKGWERENPATDLCNPSEKTMDGFVEITEQMELPF